MKLHPLLSELPALLFPARGPYRLTAAQRSDAREQVENVVDGIEPKIRLVRGYRKVLGPGVALARSYIDELVDCIPGPLMVSPGSFVNDPQVNAFFASPQELRAVFSRSSELQEFFARPQNASLDSACALLCMVAQEKTVFGMDLVQDRVRRDVHQTVVNFSDHKVLTPGASEADARRGLKDCIFNALVSHALQHIVELKAHKRELQDERRILSARLRARQAYNGGLDTLLATVSPAPDCDDTRQIEQKLAEAEQRLQQLPVARDAPREYLHQVRGILERPRDFIQLRRVSFNLNRLGVKVDGASAGRRIELAEIGVARVLKRVVVIACYPRNELLQEPAAPPGTTLGTLR
jgi:hypothetical protein